MWDIREKEEATVKKCVCTEKSVVPLWPQREWPERVANKILLLINVEL
jgi:hypothetical protein